MPIDETERGPRNAKTIAVLGTGDMGSAVGAALARAGKPARRSLDAALAVICAQLDARRDA